MRFNQLAEYFDKLEETSSRLKLIEILADLFGQINSSEIAQVIYLIQGRVAPFYEALELGMAEKNVASAISQAFFVDRDEVLRQYGQVGDLGKVAQKLSDKHHTPAEKLSIFQVFNKLKSIAQTNGEGSIEKKISNFANLLKEVTPVSVKHLTRIPLGVTRLGIGDPTVLEAFSQAKLGGRQNRQDLEAAYNRTSDLGLIGQTLWSQGLVGVKKLDVTVGRPIRSELAERLPDGKTILEKMGGRVHIQYKYDGFRVQIHKMGRVIRLFSRNLEETTHAFPDLIEGVRKQIKAESIILDSEALAFSPESDEFLPFQQTSQRRRKHGVEEMAQKLPLKAFVFDIMYLNGKSLIDLPLEQRVKFLTKEIKGNGVLLAQPGEITTEVKRVEELFDDALTKGLEGVLIKKPDSSYEAGARNFNWVKLKRHSAGDLKDTIDTVILGYIFGKGKRAEFGAGALLVGVYDKDKDEFVTVSKIGTGLTDDEWREIHKRADKIKMDHKPSRVNAILAPSVWIKPEIVIEVLADEITRSPIHTAGKTDTEAGYALRFPRLVRFREEDKKAEDATTVKELIEMYKLQYKQSLR